MSTKLSEYQLLLALASSSTDTSFDSEVPTTTKPAADQIEFPVEGDRVPDNLQLVFFGAGNDDTTFDYRVNGWAKVGSLWVNTLLAQGTATLSTTTGVASADVTNSYRFADTLDIDAPASDVEGVSAQLVSPANQSPAHLLLDVRGYSLVTVKFDLTGATSANCLYRFIW